MLAPGYSFDFMVVLPVIQLIFGKNFYQNDNAYI